MDPPALSLKATALAVCYKTNFPNLAVLEVLAVVSEIKGPLEDGCSEGGCTLSPLALSQIDW